MNPRRSSADAATCTSNHQPSEKNLRSMLIRTISWRGLKKPAGSCPELIAEQQQNVSNHQSVTETSLSQLSVQRTAVFFVKKSTDSYHSISSGDSFEEEEKGFEWVGDHLSSDEEDKQSIREDNYDDDDDDSIVLDSIETDQEHHDSNDSLSQSLNSSPSHRHLERCESRRRRRLSISRSHGSGSGLSLESSVCTHDESIDNISDSLDIGSRHSVGRSGRRRTTQNRHLHQSHRHKQISISTSSDPLCEFSDRSVLHKRLENNLKAHHQSQHSVASASRDNPRYIVLKAAESAAVRSEDHVKDRQVILKARKKDVSETTTSSVEHPRFIVIQSKPKEEEGQDKDRKPHTRRGRRRRVHALEKTNETV